MERDTKGRFIKGLRYSQNTEFQAGQHWRKKQPFWGHAWLYREYVTNKRAANDIAIQFNITEAAILFWLKKHGIARRTMKAIRKHKHWGLSGSQNGMYGVHGAAHPAWKGGVTPERQSLYNSLDWFNVSKEIWKRDNSQCQRCGKRKARSKDEFAIHHIVTFANRDLRANISNMVLLCQKCHHFVHSKRNTKREFLTGQLILA